jgi:hypothetical protein
LGEVYAFGLKSKSSLEFVHASLNLKHHKSGITVLANTAFQPNSATPTLDIWCSGDQKGDVTLWKGTSPVVTFPSTTHM